METVKTNRQYKSSVFTALFGEKENLLELYNAKKPHRDKAIPIPKPEIIVLYNGTDYMPEQQELKLSDMFIDLGDEVPNLECIVKVININKGCNEELAKRSEVLSGYESFVYLIRESAKSLDRSSAIVKAIDDCIRGNVLKKFLERNASEVRNMLFGWDWDEAKEVWQEEAREDGVAIGRDEGIAIGEARGVAIGRDEGLQQAARQMKAKGLNIALIAEITGLSEAEIERLN